MLIAFAAAVLVIGWPAIAAGAVFAPWCGDDDAAWALGPIAGLAIIVLLLEAMSAARLGGLWLSAGPLALGVVSSILLVLRRAALRWLIAPLCAAAGVVAIMAWPFRFVDGPGVLGWNVANDSAVHAVIAQYLVDGRAAPVPGSSFAGALGSYHDGYPAGSHELVAAAAPIAGGVLPAFDAALAVVVAIGAFAAYWLLRRSGANRPLAAFGALAAAGGYLQLEYYGEGFLPQMAVTPFVLGAAGLGYEAIGSRRRSIAALFGVVVAGAVATYSAYILVFVVPGLIGAVVATSIARRNDWRRALGEFSIQLALAGGTAVVLLLPSADRIMHFARSSSSTVQSQASTGNLVGPIDWKIVLGAWVGPDFRVPYVHTRETQVAMACAGVLAIAGIVGAIARRRYALPLVLATFGLASFAISRRSGIYYTAKSYQLVAIPLACAVVLGAATLAGAMRGYWGTAVGILATTLLAVWVVGVARSLESGARNLPVTPPLIRQLVALRPVVGRRPGVAAVPDDWVKFGLPSVSVPYDQASPGTPPSVLPGRGAGRFVDWDSFDPTKLAEFQAWVEPNLGGYSIPPPPFRLARSTPTVRVWLRADGSSGTRHTPFEPPGTLGGIVLAPQSRRTVPIALGRDVLLGAEPVDGMFMRPVQWNLRSSSWTVWSADPRFVVSAGTGGPARHRVVLSSSGRYVVTVIGQTSPGLEVRIGGHVLTSSTRTDLNSSTVYGTVGLGAGEHTISLVPDPQAFSYLQAVSIARVSPSRAGVVCVGNRRYSAAWDTPVQINLSSVRTIRNCGVRPVRLDWVQKR
jgi:hypothetical protein